MSGPSDILSTALRSDPGRPRVTMYDDGTGERIELSAKVLANWVAKAANALDEEWTIGPECVVRLALPPHWRSAYWALAVWAVGACVALDEGPADLVVSDDPQVLAAAGSPGVLVTLAALARSAAQPVTGDVMDEAKELATFGDQFVAVDEADTEDAALRVGETVTAYGHVVQAQEQGARLHTATSDLATWLDLVTGALAADGSVVLSRGETPEGALAHRLETEGASPV